MSLRRFILALGIHTAEEMGSVGFGIYWHESVRQISDKGDLSRCWVHQNPLPVGTIFEEIRFGEEAWGYDIWGILCCSYARGAPAINEGVQAVSAPVQAPQPPSRLPQLLGLCPKDG
ncbi:hypothetical protein Tco_0619874 [Tanacetum coccineum]